MKKFSKIIILAILILATCKSVHAQAVSQFTGGYEGIHFEGNEFVVPVKDGKRVYFADITKESVDFIVTSAEGYQMSYTEEELASEKDLLQYYKMFKDAKVKKNEFFYVKIDEKYVGHSYEYEPGSYAAIIRIHELVIAQKGNTIFFEEMFLFVPIQGLDANGKGQVFPKRSK